MVLNLCTRPFYGPVGSPFTKARVNILSAPESNPFAIRTHFLLSLLIFSLSSCTISSFVSTAGNVQYRLTLILISSADSVSFLLLLFLVLHFNLIFILTKNILII